MRVEVELRAQQTHNETLYWARKRALSEISNALSDFAIDLMSLRDETSTPNH